MKLATLLLGASVMWVPALTAAATSVFVMSLSAGKAQVLIGMSFLHGIEMRNAGRRMELIQRQF